MHAVAMTRTTESAVRMGVIRLQRMHRAFMFDGCASGREVALSAGDYRRDRQRRDAWLA